MKQATDGQNLHLLHGQQKYDQFNTELSEAERI